ncbi:hypothetical protein [Aurantibacter aestuarii]|uniref:Uncharacterized protein n=1 Tax=Aurantibacter aestuarii TaxID=1266046 RepID=A0A2T1N5N2_9FLAO|nr:hypothetical protein [Aurantibacter aestuarii]PSG86573.1 hypothetical protein C7H52_12895 [Aurantibacter aestuarii]
MMIKLKLEKLVPIHVNILGYILIFIGFYNLKKLFIEIYYLPISLICIIIGMFLSTAKTGIIIDKVNNKFKICIFFIGFEIGYWKPLNRFRKISILTKNIGLKAYSKGQRSTTFTNKVFEIYMLTENHRERIILKRYKDKDKATVFAQDIAHQLQMELNVYSPS